MDAHGFRVFFFFKIQLGYESPINSLPNSKLDHAKFNLNPYKIKEITSP